MIPPQVIEEILSLDVSEVIGRYITLTKKGVSLKACCPFHNEKTPSFTVTSSKGIYKCFGCGKAGNAIGFVMEYKKESFIEAVTRIAADHGIKIPEKAENSEDENKYKHFESLYAVNKMVAEWFAANLKSDKKALEYVKGRWNEEIIVEFQLGYAPDGWDNLKKFAAEKGIKEDILLEAGLLSEKKGKVFDYFRNRIIFPIMNRTGRIVGFTGRDFSGSPEAPKYFNTRETDIYNKGKVLYGLHQAVKAIREKDYVHLVEGNADVIRLHQIGKCNTVGSCGTSLTNDQILELKKYSNSITLIGDNDKAGRLAVMKSGKMIIEAGLFCNVISLPAGDSKYDPDSFFTDGDQFDDFAKTSMNDFIIYYAASNLNKCKSPDLKSKLIDDLSDLITKLPASSHTLYIEQLGAIIKPKKAWMDKIKSIMSEKPKEEKGEEKLPNHVSFTDWEKYGFYAEDNQYFFRTKEGKRRGTNFTMEPLFHIASVLNAKRLFKITNEFGFSQVIELQQKDLISLANFRLRIESLGNFLFEGTEIDLFKLKRYLYEQTQSCYEIVQLGWQKLGFFAWSNGIYNGHFQESDSNGIVKFEDNNYYLPSSSDIYRSEDSLFIHERSFRFVQGNLSLYDYSKKLIEVFGDNAIFGLCFYLSTLFRDHIVRITNGKFPILNLFGPKGSGKSEMAVSLLQFFGPMQVGLNITNTTKPALADHVGIFRNALCHIDEYKNSIEYEKVEFLKGLWDGTGRTRMNMDKDKKKEMSHVDVGVMLTGQEMPTADIALFSRLIFLTFSKDEFTEDQKFRFDELKKMEKTGLTHLTHEILSLRTYFIDNFLNNYREAGDELSAELKKTIIEDRIFRNWLVILAAYRTLRDKIRVPWSYNEILIKSAALIIRQNAETKRSNDLSQFWGIMEFLVNNGDIKEEVDFKVELLSSLKTDLMDSDWSAPKEVLLLNHSRVFQLYRKHGRMADAKILPLSTLDYYLKNSKEYLGRKLSVSFKVENNNRIVEDETIGGVNKTIRKITTAMAFDYKQIGISIMNITNSVNSESKDEDLPF